MPDHDATDGLPDADAERAGEPVEDARGAAARRCRRTVAPAAGRLPGRSHGARLAVLRSCPALEAGVTPRLAGRLRGGWNRCLGAPPGPVS